MTFEFVILYQWQEDVNITSLLRDRLREVLIANLNEVDEEAVPRMLMLNFQRRGPRTIDNTGTQQTRCLASFTLTLEPETASIEFVIQDFVSSLRAALIQ